MERDETEAPLLGKLDACVLSPIRTGCRDEDLCFIDDAIEGDGAGVSHQSQRPAAEKSHQTEEATAREDVLLILGSSAEP